MTARRPLSAFALTLALTLALASACGPGVREKALGTSLVSLNAARVALVAYDAHHQQEIVGTSTSLEDGTTKLADYRAKRVPLLEAFAVAYATLAAAALDLDSPTRYLDALQAAQGVYTAVKAFVDNEKVK